LEELMERIRDEYPKRLEALPEGDEHQRVLREQCVQWYHRAIFERGLVRMAFGDAPEAIRSFEEYVAEVEKLAEKLTGERKTLDPVLGIYRDFRARPLLRYLTEFHGKRPDVNFADILWATDRKLAPGDLTGKVVAIVVRRPGDKRAAGFLQEIDRFVAERRKDGLLGLTLSFFTSGAAASDKEELLGEMRRDLSGLGVSLPGGFDPDEQRQKLLRAIYATLGTASFVVLDREGKSAWFLQDPKDLDRKLALRVLERLLAEK